MRETWFLTFIPVLASFLGACWAVSVKPGPNTISAIQHLAAGVVFAAAAGEILPDLKHEGAALPVVIGGLAGVATMLLVKQLEERFKGPIGLVAAVSVDVFIDGLVVGLGFVAGQREGLLLTIAITMEILFLGLTVAEELGGALATRTKIVAGTTAICLLLPLGALLGIPASQLPSQAMTGFFAFGLIALLYLVTEELLVKAHETPDRPWVTAMFYIGFLSLLLLEEAIRP